MPEKLCVFWIFILHGELDRTWTYNLQLRRLLLYPIELRVHVCKKVKPFRESIDINIYINVEASLGGGIPLIKENYNNVICLI